ncbi:MAG TPA: hypothetical protein VFU15_12950, partial [Bacteroidia bacterium]|nr:hypothetical protein [Bacteroidia bacterium]
AKIMEKKEARDTFNRIGQGIYNEVLVLNPHSKQEAIDAVKAKAERIQRESISSDLIFSSRRALNLLKLLESERKGLD